MELGEYDSSSSRNRGPSDGPKISGDILENNSCDFYYIWVIYEDTTLKEDRMTGQNYIEFLQNESPEQLEDVPLATGIAVHSQHDGAPPHYARLVMKHINDTFHNRWIGRGSTINWPLRSPDLSPLDSCSWG
jgi:hypothetical protein